ncbi:MAG: ATP synthase subunit I [Bryobacteraceae bacterium]|jgi:ATP synthase I chain
MSVEPDIFERTAASVTRTMLAVGFAGAIVAFAWLGWRAGFGFALGAIAAWFNFRWLKGFVGGLGPGGKPGRFAVFFALRYLILAAGAYVILKYSKLSLPAALSGLFVPLAAVIVEVLIQLRYERRDLDH